jgi:Domain of unknown function (DUF4265)
MTVAAEAARVSDDPTLATHATPARLDPDAVLVEVDLEAFGMPGRREQLSTSPIAPDRFEVGCIPFFTYGIALGDVVSARKGDDAAWVMEGVVTRSGHRTVRLAIESAARAQELHEHLHTLVAETGLAHEWHGSGYVAIDIPPDKPPEEVLRLFAEHVKAEAIVAEVDE